MSKKSKSVPPPDVMTGWEPGMLQDDSRPLSKWLANRIDSKKHAREASEEIKESKVSAELDFEDHHLYDNRLAAHKNRPVRVVIADKAMAEDQMKLHIDAKIARLILPQCYSLIRDMAKHIDPMPRELQIRMAQLLPKQER